MTFINSARKNYLNHLLFDSLDDGNLRNVEYLLTVKRANPNGYLEDLDSCPMHCAVGAGTESFAYEATSLCLQNGGDPNIRNRDGETPLHIAAWWGRRKVVGVLLSYGGDPLIRDGDGNSAIDLAVANNQHHVYSQFIVHRWMPKRISVQNKMALEDTHAIEESHQKEWWKQASDESKLSIYTSNLDSFTDIESELNFVEIFIPPEEEMALSRISSVPSITRSTSDVSTLQHYWSCRSNCSSTLTKSNSAQSLSSLKSEGSTKSWETEYVRRELRRLNIFYGPVLKTTKRLYVRQLKKIMKNPERAELFKSDEDGFNEIIANTFGPRLPDLLLKWTPLIDEMTQCCLDQPGRGSKERCYFNYILLDPLTTCNLPTRMQKLNQWEAWTIFIKAVFYIGKGKNSRPMAHLYDAMKSTTTTKSKKIARIKFIWSVGAGIICVQAFHNLTEGEAYNREASMIDALQKYTKLTNQQAGEYSGKLKYWPMKKKIQLGILLLYRAMQIYVADYERQIHPTDLKP